MAVRHRSQINLCDHLVRLKIPSSYYIYQRDDVNTVPIPSDQTSAPQRYGNKWRLPYTPYTLHKKSNCRLTSASGSSRPAVHTADRTHSSREQIKN